MPEIQVKDKLINAEGLKEGYDALDNKKLDIDFSSLPTATTPYANTDLLALYRGGAMYNTDMQTLIAELVFAPSTLTNNAAFHNAIPRGKYLGNHVSAEQYAEIAAGTFAGMFIGDYWTMDGIDYVIIDFDPYYSCGDNISLGHHIAVMPRSSMASAAWNIGSNDTSKMYVGSDVRVVTIQGLTSGSTPNVDNEAGIQNTIFNAFGKAHVLKYRALYPSSQSSGSATGWAWVDARVELLNEVEVYGTQVWINDGKGNGYEIGINKRQLSIFRLWPDFCNIRAHWWLRSVDGATHAVDVISNGSAFSASASASSGVRPFFLIG